MCEDDSGKLVKSRKYTWIYNNRMLGVDGIVGMKTGWTPLAGHCIAVSFDKDGHNSVMVSIDSKTKSHLWTGI